MPRNVRNFWLELAVDGKRTDVATGPRSADGGFELTLRQRNHGTVEYAGSLRGIVRHGKLTLEFVPAKPTDILTLLTTER